MPFHTTDLDHVGVVVRDLTDSAKAYRRLGFTLSPVARHSGATEPGGPTVLRATANRCAMFKRGYIELISVVDPSLPGAAIGNRISAAEGIHIVAFGCDDIEEASVELQRRGFDVSATVYLERTAETPNGARLAKFVRAPTTHVDMPEAEIFHIKHLTRDVVWQPQLLEHYNGVVGLEEIVVQVANLEEAASRFERYLGVPQSASKGQRTFALKSGRCVLSEHEQVSRAAGSLSPHVVGITVMTNSLNDAERILKQNAVMYERVGEKIVVDPKDACGVSLVFETA
jgi:hypothetical protein